MEKEIPYLFQNPLYAGIQLHRRLYYSNSIGVTLSHVRLHPASRNGSAKVKKLWTLTDKTRRQAQLTQDE
jgi:hypothetical protein